MYEPDFDDLIFDEDGNGYIQIAPDIYELVYICIDDFIENKPG